MAYTDGASVLRLIVDLAGYDFDDDIYTTNTVKCCTVDTDIEDKVWLNCSSFLYDEIVNIRPKKIAVFGKPAKKSISEIIENKQLDVNDIQIDYFPHYSYVMNYHGMDLKECIKDIIEFLT